MVSYLYFEPEYHGNPMTDKGSLVFYDFVWDLLNMIKDAGFKDVYIIVISMVILEIYLLLLKC